jgi:hypothetical protein
MLVTKLKRIRQVSMDFSSYKREVLKNYDKNLTKFGRHPNYEEIKKHHSVLKEYLIENNTILNFFCKNGKNNKNVNKLKNNLVLLKKKKTVPLFVYQKDADSVGKLLMILVSICAEHLNPTRLDLRSRDQLKQDFSFHLSAIKNLQKFLKENRLGDSANLIAKFREEAWSRHPNIFRKMTDDPDVILDLLLTNLSDEMKEYFKPKNRRSTDSISETVAARSRRSDEKSKLHMLIISLSVTVRSRTGKPMNNLVAEVVSLFCDKAFTAKEIKFIVAKIARKKVSQISENK